MSKVFNASAENTAVYKLNEAKVQIGASTAVFLNVQISFSRTMSPIPTLGSGLHWGAGTPSGQMTVGSIYTKDTSLLEELGALDDACKVATITISMEGAVCKAGGQEDPMNLVIKGAHCSNLGFTLSPGNGYIANDVTIMFSELDIGG